MAVNGVRSPVRTGGPAPDASEAAVFVHGNNAGADWTALLTSVAQFARVIAPDMPGFGDADKPDNWPYTVDAYADHLGGIVDQLGVVRSHLVAHDFGGPWALAWAAQHLDAVASITLINTPARIDHFAAKLWRTPVVAEVGWRLSSARMVGRLLSRSDPHVPRAALDQIACHTMVPETQRAVIRLYRATGKDAIGKYADRLRGFTGKVLIVFGDEDNYIPVKQAEQQQKMFRHADVRTVPGAGHWPWLEQPDRVSEYLSAFLREQMGCAPHS